MDVLEEENSQHALSLYYTRKRKLFCWVKLYIWSSKTSQEIKGKPRRGHIMTSSRKKMIPDEDILWKNWFI